jgi:hypothetical protein
MAYTILITLLAALFAQQDAATVHIKVTLVDASKTVVPIARAALLISDEPPTSAPRRIVTGADGTATTRLRPGLYLVESDDPVAFGGKGYEWRQEVRITAGKETTLEFTAANAVVGAAPPPPAIAPDAPSPATSRDAAPTGAIGVSLPPQAMDSVVVIWTDEARASGFLFNSAGLVATNRRVVAGAVTVDVQVSPSIKVSARVLVDDRARDVAILWIDPAATATLHPVSLNCATPVPPLVDGQRLVALGAPLRGQKEESPGELYDPKEAVADFRLGQGSLGGPVFTGNGVFAGLSSAAEDVGQPFRAAGAGANSYRSSRDVRVVSAGDVCTAANVGEKSMASAKAPSPTHLPVEPEKPADPTVYERALANAVRQRAGNLNPYQFSSANFDVTLLTPVTVHGAQQRGNYGGSGGYGGRGGGRGGGGGYQQQSPIVVTDFGEWSDYFDENPAVLVIRVTPKMAEGFWTTVGRTAASTQGVNIPSMKHFKPGFSRMRAYCGDTEVTPIHPFTLLQRVSDTDYIREGLYVFDPKQFSTECTAMKLVMFSEKEPDKPDTKVVDPKIVTQVQSDFSTFPR